VHRPQATLELDEVLPMLEALEQVALGTFLSVCQVFEDAVFFEKTSDLVQTLLKPLVGTDAGHSGPPVAIAGSGAAFVP
jgi:hypothetical protein